MKRMGQAHCIKMIALSTLLPNMKRTWVVLSAFLFAVMVFALAADRVSAAAPVFDSGLATSIHVYDYTPGGTAFWTPYTATDGDGDTLTYSLENLTGSADANSFSIASGTGQLSVASGVTLDAAVKSSYTFNVVVNDGNSPADKLELTVEARKCEDGHGIWCGTVTAGASDPAEWIGYGSGYGTLLPKTVISVPGQGELGIALLVEGAANSDTVRLTLDPTPTASQRQALEDYALKVTSEGGGYEVLYFGGNWKAYQSYYEWTNTEAEWRNTNSYDVSVVPLYPWFPEASRTIDVYHNHVSRAPIQEPVTATYYGSLNVTYRLEDQPGRSDTDFFSMGVTDGRIRVYFSDDPDLGVGSSYRFDVTGTAGTTARTEVVVNVLECPALWCGTVTAEDHPGSISSYTGYAHSQDYEAGRLLPTTRMALLDGTEYNVRAMAKSSVRHDYALFWVWDGAPTGPSPFYGYAMRVETDWAATEPGMHLMPFPPNIENSLIGVDEVTWRGDFVCDWDGTRTDEPCWSMTAGNDYYVELVWIGPNSPRTPWISPFSWERTSARCSCRQPRPG